MKDLSLPPENHLLKQELRILDMKNQAVIVVPAELRNLLNQHSITFDDLDKLEKEKELEFYPILSNLLLQAEGDELDDLLRKVEPIMEALEIERLWDRNQARITWAVKDVMNEEGRMPTQTEIAVKTGLSRRTVSAHFCKSPHMKAFISARDQYEFYTHSIMEKLMVNAMKGDIKAARLFLERADRELLKKPQSLDDMTRREREEFNEILDRRRRDEEDL